MEKWLSCHVFIGKWAHRISDFLFHEFSDIYDDDNNNHEGEANVFQSAFDCREGNFLGQWKPQQQKPQQQKCPNKEDMYIGTGYLEFSRNKDHIAKFL